MIEGILVQGYNICVPPLVIGVAIGAFDARYFRREAVETRSRLQILCDFYVAIQAQLIL